MISATGVKPCTSHRHFRGRGRGFTLMEMVISLVIISILMVGMGGALVMSSQAFPDSNSRIGTINESADIVDAIASELTYATSVTEMTSTAVTFTVADRNSDSNPETIRYAWSGTPGDPLTRRYNGGAVIEVIGSVQSFEMTYGLETETESDSVDVVVSAEMELANRGVLSAPSDYAITDGNAIGQYFMPVLSNDATAWSVERVLVMARVNGQAKGETYVRLCLPDVSDRPSATVHEEFVMDEKTELAAGYTWEEFACSSVSGLAPDEGICLTLTFKSTSSAADIQYDTGGGSGLLTSADNGSTWSTVGGESMQFYIYGTETTETTTPGESQSWLQTAAVAIQISDDASTRTEATARVLNEPEVTP